MAGNGNGIAWKLFGAMVTVHVMLAGVGVKMVLDLSADVSRLVADVAGIKGALAVRIEKADQEREAFAVRDADLEAKIEQIRERLNGR
jgi:hypothetical protein